MEPETGTAGNRSSIAKTVIWLVVLVLIVGGLIVYGNKGDKKEAVSTEPIKIGFVGPLTEKLASIGESSLAGAELAVKEINTSGGVLGRQIVLVAEDDKCSAKGLDAFNKLMNADKVVAISGPDCSSSGSAALPVAQTSKMPTVVRWASAPPLAKIGDYIFRVYPSDAFQGKFVAEYIKNTLKKNKVAVLYVKNDWGQGIADVFTETFKSLGGTIVFTEGVLEDSRDLRTQVQNMKRANAEVIFAPLHEATGIVGLKQMKEAGIAVPVIGGDVFDSQAVFESLGAEGVMYSAAVVSNPADFQQKIKTETGKDGSKITAPLGYDSIMVIADAIRRADSTDPVAIRTALESTSIKGVGTPLITFDSDGDLVGGQFEIKIIKNKSSETVK